MAAQSASRIDKLIIDLLIEKGCDVTLQDKVTFPLKLKEFINQNFRTERHLMRWLKMVKGELSFGSISYAIILMEFSYVFVLIGRPIFRSSTRKSSSGFD